jgi:DNA repair exonuclease SbcCD ATPase subunit
MNTVTSVKYQNFLASGNAPISIDVTKHATTLVVGKNGAGKSTLHEAICFAWFGRPLRKVNKPSLVNWVNNRDCLVELEWRVPNGTKYLVKRGIKPNIFEIYKNGILEPIPADLDDYQTHLESLIKLNHKSFMQVVVLGGSSYVPFMRLAAAARREIIEDLLDIEVFSSMNALNKEDLLELKSSLEKNVTMRNLLTEQVKMAQTFEQEIEDHIQARLAALDTNIASTNETIADLLKDRTELVAALVPYGAVRDEKKRSHDKVVEFDKTLYKLQSQDTKVKADRAFYTVHDTCPECEQVITDTFKNEKFGALTYEEATLSKALTQCQGLIAKYRKAEDVADEQLEGAERIEDSIQNIDAKLPVHKRRLRELEQEKVKAQAPKTEKPKVDTDALVKQLAGLQQDHTKLATERVILDAAGMLLKDNGIKTRIIRHYLHIINRHINGYL